LGRGSKKERERGAGLRLNANREVCASRSKREKRTVKKAH